MVLAVYGWSVFGSPAFGQLADQGYHLASLESFDASWRSGEFPPGWDAAANGGRGSPGFVLYPPAFAFLGATAMRCGLDATEALRTALLLSAAALFGGVWYLAAAWASPRRAALGAAVACLLPGATFPSLARGMYPAFLALAALAVLLGALDRLAQPEGARNGATVMACLAAGLLILTHSLSAYMALCLVLVASPWLVRALGREGVGRAILAAVGALALTGWFWGPMLRVAAEAQTGYLAEAHPYAASLLGGSASAGTALKQSWAELNEVGQAVAIVQLLLAVALAWSLRDSPKSPSLAVLPAAIVFIALASAAPTGAWLTQLPGFDKLQFAWRWQGPLAVLCGAALAALPAGRRAAPATLSALVILTFLPFATPADRPWQEPQTVTRSYSPEEFEEVDAATRALYLHNRIEMRPAGADRRLYPPGEPGRIEVVEGKASIVAETIEPSLRTYRVETLAPVTLRLFTYAFDGWSASADGMPLAIRTEPGTGLQLVTAPPGSYRLELNFDRFAH